MSYTERFSESHKLLACVGYSGVTTEQNTSWLNIKNYRRVAIVIKAIAVGTSLNADLEIATSDGGTAHTLKSITELGGSDDDNAVVIELRDEELSKPASAASSEYDWIRLESTPSGSCTYVVTVWGLEPRYAPVGVTEWDEVVA